VEVVGIIKIKTPVRWFSSGLIIFKKGKYIMARNLSVVNGSDSFDPSDKSVADIEIDLGDWLCKKQVIGMPELDGSLKVLRNKAGYRIFHVDDHNVCEEIEISQVRKLLENSVRNSAYRRKISFKTISLVVNRWLDCNAEQMEYEPVPQTLHDSTRYAFSRLEEEIKPIDLQQLEEHCPQYHAMMVHMENNECWAAMRWDAYVGSYGRKQAIYLHGESGVGKTTLCDAFGEMLGGEKAYVSVSTKYLDGPFAMELLVGKALAAITEVSESYLKTKDFLILTGEQNAAINPKGRPGYMAKIGAQIILTSNDELEIPDLPEIKNRIITCYLKKYDREDLPDEVIKGIFKDKKKYILGYSRWCWEKFQRENKGKIVADKTSLDVAVKKHEERYQDVFDVYFKYSPEGTECVRCADAHAAIKKTIKSRRELGAFKKWLEKEYKILARKPEINGKDVRAYRNMAWSNESIYVDGKRMETLKIAKTASEEIQDWNVILSDK
jgi:hypothetical protein